MKTSPKELLTRTCSLLGGSLLILGFVILAGSELGFVSLSLIGLSILFIGILVTLFALILLDRRSGVLDQELDQINAAADLLAKGRIDVPELNAHGSELKNIGEYHREIAKMAARITSGDFSAKFQPRGPEDRLGKALSDMCNALDSRFAELEHDRIGRDEIARLKRFALSAAAGDLTNGFDKENDHQGETAAAIAELAKGLSDRLRNAQEAAAQVNSAVASLSSIAGDITAASETRTRETTSAAGNVAGIARQASAFFDSIKQAAEPLTESSRTAAAALESAGENVSAMRLIRNHVQESVKRTKRIGERSQELSRMVSDFEELADRASLLSLNSSLRSTKTVGEAAVSGSTEVQQIAERTTRLTDQISQLIHSLSFEAKEASASLEAVIREVILGSSIAEKVGRTLHELNSGLGDSTSNLGSIVENADHHSKSYEELSRSVSAIASSDQAYQNASRKSLAAVRELVRSAGELRNALEFFKLPPAPSHLPAKALENDKFVN